MSHAKTPQKNKNKRRQKLNQNKLASGQHYPDCVACKKRFVSLHARKITTKKKSPLKSITHGNDHLYVDEDENETQKKSSSTNKCPPGILH